jgi:hypothetical protein
LGGTNHQNRLATVRPPQSTTDTASSRCVR